VATIELERPRSRAIPITLCAVAAFGVLIMIWGTRSPAQIGADDAVFHTVDALYTAVRMEDPTKLEACAQRLANYRDAGILPADAAKQLEGIIETARSGKWSIAAETLYYFMRGQKRGQ
jgi:hypothetical protein